MRRALRHCSKAQTGKSRQVQSIESIPYMMMDDVETESPANARTKILGGKFLAQDTVDKVSSRSELQSQMMGGNFLTQDTVDIVDSRSELRSQMVEVENRDKHQNHQNRFRALEAFNQKTCFRLIVVLLLCICMFAALGFYGRGKKNDLQQKVNGFIKDIQNMNQTLSWLVGKFNSMNPLVGKLNITNLEVQNQIEIPVQQK